jgi:hypothetical protein
MTYQTENISLFIDGSKPMSDWDDYCAELEAMGLGRCSKYTTTPTPATLKARLRAMTNGRSGVFPNGRRLKQVC